MDDREAVSERPYVVEAPVAEERVPPTDLLGGAMPSTPAGDLPVSDATETRRASALGVMPHVPADVGTVDASGKVVVELDAGAAAEQIARMIAEYKLDSVAIALLGSFAQ